MIILSKNKGKVALVIFIPAMLLAFVLVKEPTIQNRIKNYEQGNHFVISELRNNANVVLYERTSCGTIIAAKWFGDENTIEQTKKKSSRNLDFFLTRGVILFFI